MKLIATKNQTYKTRHLVAGDPFEEASERRAHLLISIGKARPAESITPRNKRLLPEVVTPPPPLPTIPHVSADDDEITRLRKTARRLGIIVDKRWGSQTLRDRIAAAQGSS